MTGASGFLGHNVLLRAPRAWEIVAVSHTTPGLDRFVAEYGLTHVRTFRGDLTNADDVARLVGMVDGRADAVLYLAANGDPALSSEHPRLDLESNAPALVSFLEGCPADHLVYMSSGAVYDGLHGPVTPETPVSPRLPYAIAKLACEQYVRFFAERRKSLGSYINVRFFGAYGPYEAERKITTRWLRAMAAGQREFTIRGDGRNLIDFMYVDDAVDGLMKLVEARGQSLTVDFASGRRSASTTSSPRWRGRSTSAITVRHEGTVAEYIEFHSADTTMRDRFGVVPSIPFDEGLRRLAEFFQDQPTS